MTDNFIDERLICKEDYGCTASFQIWINNFRTQLEGPSTYF